MPADAASAPWVDARPSLMTPPQAADHVAACYRFASVMGQVLEAQVMEACWRVWRAPADEAERLVRERTPLTPARSRRYAECWEAARANRPVMDLAVARPSEALRLVSDVADALATDGADDENGAELARLAALPRRERARELRALVAARASSQRPEDALRIRELEDDLADARAEAEAARPSPSWTALHRLLAQTQDQLHEADAAAARLAAVVTARHRERVLRAVDGVRALADAIAETVDPPGEPGIAA